jgi:hypothetical protein
MLTRIQELWMPTSIDYRNVDLVVAFVLYFPGFLSLELFRVSRLEGRDPTPTAAAGKGAKSGRSKGVSKNRKKRRKRGSERGEAESGGKRAPWGEV